MNRILCVAIGFALGAAIASPSPAQQPARQPAQTDSLAPMRSLVIPGDSNRGMTGSGSARFRSLMDSATATLRRLEIHETTLAPGASPHPPHRHAHDEIMLVQRGTLRVSQEGVVRRAGPGSLILQSSNELHGLTNVGADTAVYWVIAIYPRDLRDSTDRR
jgi:quercetin dioxygenase-like cupin family protein